MWVKNSGRVSVFGNSLVHLHSLTLTPSLPQPAHPHSNSLPLPTPNHSPSDPPTRVTGCQTSLSPCTHLPPHPQLTLTTHSPCTYLHPHLHLTLTPHSPCTYLHPHLTPHTHHSHPAHTSTHTSTSHSHPFTFFPFTLTSHSCWLREATNEASLFQYTDRFSSSASYRDKSG